MLGEWSGWAENGEGKACHAKWEMLRIRPEGTSAREWVWVCVGGVCVLWHCQFTKFHKYKLVLNVKIKQLKWPLVKSKVEWHQPPPKICHGIIFTNLANIRGAVNNLGEIMIAFPLGESECKSEISQTQAHSHLHWTFSQITTGKTAQFNWRKQQIYSAINHFFFFFVWTAEKHWKLFMVVTVPEHFIGWR